MSFLLPIVYMIRTDQSGVSDHVCVYVVPQVQCSTPAWVMGAKAALGLRRPATATPAAAVVAAAPVVKLWSVAAGSDDDDGDMMDDEDLLTEEDKKRPTGDLDRWLRLVTCAAHCWSYASDVPSVPMRVALCQ